MKLVRSELPPYETNGKVTPVMGASLAFPAIMTHACTTSATVSPAARNRSKGRMVRAAMRNPRDISIANSATMARAPAKPNSSPTVAKTKSVCTAGM